MDITSPRGRATRGTANTLDARTVGVRTARTVGVRTVMMGTRTDELWGVLGVNHGWGHGVQTGINLLHASAGLLNLHIKWAAFQKRSWAVSALFAPDWMHGSWVWLKRDSEIIGNIDVVALPFGVATTSLPFPFVQFDLEAVYSHVEAFGDLDSASLTFDTDLLLRTFRLSPTLRFHLQKRVSLAFSARLPVYASSPGSIETSVELEPGIEAGARTSGARCM